MQSPSLLKKEVQISNVCKKEMDFPDAIREITNGKLLTRKEWNNPNICILLKDNKLKIILADRTFHDLIVSDGDMLGTDWVIVESSMLTKIGDEPNESPV